MVRLELLGPRGPTQSLDLDDMEGVHITQVDLGYPEIREDSEPRPNANGMIDRTKFWNSRVVTIEGKLAIGMNRQAVADALGPFLVPSVRPVLTVETDNGLRRMVVRADQFSKPQLAGVQDISISFKAAGGGLESEEENLAVIRPDMPVEGRAYDLVFDRIYPPGSATWVPALNDGSAPVDWLARIYGPCTGPRLANVEAGAEISLPRLSLVGPHQFVEIDSANHTVFADGLSENSRYGSLDFVATTWWQLLPGRNRIQMFVGSWQWPSHTDLIWRDSYVV